MQSAICLEYHGNFRHYFVLGIIRIGPLPHR